MEFFAKLQQRQTAAPASRGPPQQGLLTEASRDARAAAAAGPISRPASRFIRPDGAEPNSLAPANGKCTFTYLLHYLLPLCYSLLFARPLLTSLTYTQVLATLRWQIIQVQLPLSRTLVLSLGLKFNLLLPALVLNLALFVLSKISNPTAIVNPTQWNISSVCLCFHHVSPLPDLMPRCIALKPIPNHASMDARHATFVGSEQSILRLYARCVKA